MKMPASLPSVPWVRVLAVLLALTGLLRVAFAATPARPNILFILTDDQGPATLGCYGGRLVPTPHLDQFARDGVRFTDAYVMPQCSPTRAALLSGQHSARTRLWHVLPWYGSPWARVTEPPFREQFSRDAFTLPKGLRDAGYATGMAGKWHLTTGADGGYNFLNASAGPAYGFDFVAPPGSGSPNEGDKWVDHLTDEAIGFITRQRERPWFFYLAHHTIHGKVSAPGPLVEKYLARGAPATGLHNATYLAAIEHMDTAVGRLLAKLDELKLRESTLVVFLSDNGGVYQAMDKDSARPGAQLKLDREEFSNAPLRAGKGSPYEGGLRVPCLVRWPGVTVAGAVNSTPIHVVDWLPTLLAAAGATPPQAHVVDGRDLAPVLRGAPTPVRPLYWYLPLYDLRWAATPCAVVREGDWKLIEYFGEWFDAAGRQHDGRHLELFDLRADLGETKNRAGSDPAVAQRLSDQLHAWLRSVPAEIPGSNPHFDAARRFEETKTKQPWNP